MKRLLPIIFFIATISAEEEPRTLNVTGTGKVVIAATLADIRLGIEIEGKQASVIQAELAQKVTHLVGILKELPHERLDTGSFQIFPEYSKDSPPEIRGYRGRAEILITTSTENAGTTISKALETGVNQIQGIELRASENEILAAKKEALQSASKQALELALVVLSELKLKLKEIQEISIEPQNHFPVPLRMASYAKTEVSLPVEGEQEIQTSVSLKIGFKEDY